MRRGRRAAPEPQDPVERFGTPCPVCRMPLGRTLPPADPATGRFRTPPSFRLDVGAPDGGSALPWRVTMLAGKFPAAVSTDPPFHEHEIDYVYLLCGGGHIFPDSAPVFHGGADGAGRQHIDEWNMVAAMGAPASGKTYLLVRMLKQSLDNPDDWRAAADHDRIRLRKLTPLEELPLSGRIARYNETRQTGEAIQPTGMDQQATPAGILADRMGDALDAIRELIRRTVLDGDRQARRWGRGFRQPLVLRTDSGGRRTWTGVADLPGELFQDNGSNRREAGMLRSFDTLLWVVDPAVALSTSTWLASDSAADERLLLDGSLRPGTVAASGAEIVRGNREDIQDDIGQQITMVDGLFAVDEGRPLQVMIAVTKCDLIHTALEKRGLSLATLGPPGEVLHGTAGYLSVTMERWAAGTLRAEGETERLLQYLWGSHSAEPEVRDRRALQVAEGLLGFFSHHDNFWKLVHTGDGAEIPIPGGAAMAEVPQLVRLPSLNQHLSAGLRPGSGALLLPRDLIMSAVGCGIASGLGQRHAITGMHREQWITLRFFLCSPLTTVPIALDEVRLRPLRAGARFPQAHDRAAALTQLLLAVLGRARR